jgi:hypothetical protein
MQRSAKNGTNFRYMFNGFINICDEAIEKKLHQISTVDQCQKMSEYPYLPFFCR